jgi:bacterioferritin-associated ferredoxin
LTLYKERDGMIVCVCNALRETEVRSAARQGATCPTSAYAMLGRRPRCGQCFPFARDIISAERTAS